MALVTKEYLVKVLLKPIILFQRSFEWEVTTLSYTYKNNERMITFAEQ